MTTIDYDEFGLFHENAAEFGLPFDGPPMVRRESVEVRPGFRLSALVWGNRQPELVLLHGGGQNAHTWDTVAMALGRPLIAIDLPGHGHSDGSIRSALSLEAVADDIATVIRALAAQATAVVGMSLGGLTALALSAAAPDLVRRLVLVDVLPSRDDAASAVIGKFINGPAAFADFDELLAHDRVQPDQIGVVTAPGHSAQRRPAARRLVDVAARTPARRPAGRPGARPR